MQNLRVVVKLDTNVIHSALLTIVRVYTLYLLNYLLTYNIGAHILICLCQISFLEMTKLTSAEAILTFNCPSYHSFNSVKPSR